MTQSNARPGISFDELIKLVAANAIHTVEVGAPDTQGHLRGKRVPAGRFVERVAHGGLNIADAMFVFDMQNDLPDHPIVNMESGYLDCRLVPDLESIRLLTHRPGYALVMADAVTVEGDPHPLAPRGVLARQAARCAGHGVTPIVATELEFYLCDDEWRPVQSHIQYSSLTDAVQLEAVLAAMRAALIGAGIEVESSNAEYGPGQIEINTGPADALTTADNTVLFKSIVKQVAAAHGMRATFMPKPFDDQSGSGMHVHSSLAAKGVNSFGSSAHHPNDSMSVWLAGLLAHAASMTLLGAPTPNGSKRIKPYTFAPTHVHWGLDNRTVLARCICEPGSPANRVEYRHAGADAHPHLMIAGLLAAGADGIERRLDLPPMSIGDMYTNPGDAAPVPTDFSDAVDAFEASAIAAQLGSDFARGYVCLARHEAQLVAANSPDPDAVNAWERERYAAHC